MLALHDSSSRNDNLSAMGTAGHQKKIILANLIMLIDELMSYVTACPQQRLRLQQAKERMERKLHTAKQQRQEAEERRRQLDNRVVKAGQPARPQRLLRPKLKLI